MFDKLFSIMNHIEPEPSTVKAATKKQESVPVQSNKSSEKGTLIGADPFNGIKKFNLSHDERILKKIEIIKRLKEELESME